MKSWAIVILSVISIACLALCAVIWNDNRHLLEKMTERASDCVAKENYRTIMDVCGRLSAVNAQQDLFLQRVRGNLEDLNERRTDGKVWRAAGREKNSGLGRGGS